MIAHSNYKWICFLTILVINSTGWAQEQPDSVLIIARQWAEQKEYHKAIPVIIQLKQQYPEDKDIALFLAHLYYWSFSYTDAREVLIPLADPVSGNEDAFELLIRIEFQLEHYENVVNKSEEGKRAFPSRLNFFLFQQALAFEKLNEDKKALVALSQLTGDYIHSRDVAYLKTQIFKKNNNTVSVGYLNTSFNQPGFAPWHLAHLEYLWRSSSIAVGGRLNYGYLFGGDAAQAEIIAYPKLSRHSYLDINAGYSAAERIFPIWRLGAEWFNDQKRINYSLGARYLDFRTIQVLMLTSHLGVNFKAWKTGYRYYEVRQNEHWFASHIITLRRSFELRESYVQLDLQYGAIPYYFFSTDIFSRIKAYRIGLNGMIRIRDNFFIQPVLMYEREEYIPDTFRNRYNFQFIFSKRF